MTGCVYTFMIPDLSQPIANRTNLSPSGMLEPFEPKPLEATQVVGRRIDELTTSAGTYGMGGPGFLALRLGEDWLVVALWGAAGWMTCQGRLVEDFHFDTAGRPRPWISDGLEGDELSPRIVGQTITGFSVGRACLIIGISGGFDLTIAEDPAARPVFAGNGQPRVLVADDDLRRAVFLSPTTELWI